MYHPDEIISISVNYIRPSAVASVADVYFSILIPEKEPKAREALKVLGFSASQSGNARDTNKCVTKGMSFTINVGLGKVKK